MDGLSSGLMAEPSSPKSPRKQRFNLPEFNPLLMGVAALLVSYGLLVVYSAVSVDPDYSFSRQLFGAAVGAVLMVAIQYVDYRRLADATIIFLVINVALILSPHLPIIGVTTMGATSWIDVGMQLQPGEFAKVTVILLDASVVARYGGSLNDPKEYGKAIGIMLIPFVCIMTQPDLGTGLVYLFIGAVTLIAGGAKSKFLLITLAVFVGMIGAVFLCDELIKNSTGAYKLLQQYQRDRLFVFMNQESSNPNDVGYNLHQAMIAIGSGGFFGQGYMQGSQHALGILPEAPTDFIFCVLAEELGFAGVLLLLALYVALVIIGLYIAYNAADMFGLLIAAGITGMWMFQILENIGMTCGLMPITGIPLPFMSFGSSFMIVNFVLLGLLGSVWCHRNENLRRGKYAASR